MQCGHCNKSFLPSLRLNSHQRRWLVMGIWPVRCHHCNSLQDPKTINGGISLSPAFAFSPDAEKKLRAEVETAKRRQEAVIFVAGRKVKLL